MVKLLQKHTFMSRKGNGQKRGNCTICKLVPQSVRNPSVSVNSKAQFLGKGETLETLEKQL